jgi:hypothetical protein
MAVLRRHCDKCKQQFIVSELCVRKGYFYCKKCVAEIDGTYIRSKENIFKDAARKIALGQTEELQSKMSVTNQLGDIQSPIEINSLFESTQLDEQQTKDAMTILEKKMAQQMLSQALGYKYDEEEITLIKAPSTEHDPGGWVEVKKKITKKHQPGNSQLFIMFMTNMFGDKWKVSKELIHSKPQGYDSEPSTRDRKKVIALARQVLEANPDDTKG